MKVDPHTINKLINWVCKLPRTHRYTALSLFAETMGMDYEKVKEIMYGICEALRGKENDAAIYLREGKIDGKKAERACEIFLGHAPWYDVERLKDIYPDPVIDGIVEEFVEYLRAITEMRVKMGGDRVKAYARAWKIVGEKIHYELPKIILESPEERVREAVLRLWEVNFLKIQAAYHLEKARYLLFQKTRYLKVFKSIKREILEGNVGNLARKLSDIIETRDIIRHWKAGKRIYAKAKRLE